MVNDKGSLRTVAASTKVTPCLRTLSEAFCWFQTKRKSTRQYIPLSDPFDGHSSTGEGYDGPGTGGLHGRESEGYLQAMAERILVLEGSVHDRGFLLNQAWTSELRVELEGGFFRLRAPLLLTTDSDQTACEKGVRLVRWINGAAALLNPSYVGVHLVEVDEVLSNGALRRGNYQPPPRATGSEGGFAVIQQRVLESGTAPVSQRPAIVRWVTLASRDSAVAAALEFVFEKAGRWGQLYRTVEAVRVALGDSYREVVGETLYGKRKQFEQSANYAQPGDRHKRHPHEPSPRGAQPKKKEMLLPEAEEYMRDIVTAFLEREAKLN
jgi:hypothetical protein